MIAGTKISQFFSYFLVFHYWRLASGDAVQCMQSEQVALLKFKEGFNTATSHFLSWPVEDNCCNWKGVGCNNRTGHVVTLDLHSTDASFVLQGKLSDSLVDLAFLSYLDLSGNNFDQIHVPEFIGSLHNLEYLNLLNAKFKGTLPDNLGNITRLRYLDLSGNSLRVNNLNWLYHLSALKVLDLSGVDLSNSENWLDAINMLPSLEELYLPACQLHTLPLSLPYLNFTSLEALDLSYNYLNSEIPKWLFDLGHSLAYLNLSRNELNGGIPNDFGKMTSLAFLDLSKSFLTGPIPAVWSIDLQSNLGHSSLRHLHLSHNQLSGSIENSLAQFSGLIALNVAFNNLEGAITEVHLQNFSRLQILDLSFNSITLNVSSNWIPAFQLDVIGLGSVNVGKTFPRWIHTQKNFSSIDITNANISDRVPDWFWNISLKVEKLSLSNNKLWGKVPDLSHLHELSTLDLSYNLFDGIMPHFPTKMVTLVLTDNNFSGPVSSLCHIMSERNSPVSYLDLSRNNLSGPLPDCWENGTSLTTINLAENALSGTIPNSIGYLSYLRVLRLDHNYLHGELPSSLRNCRDLFVLDLGDNRFSGSILMLIGETLNNLMIFNLRGNEFNGRLPFELCNLKNVVNLDLSRNKFSGTIPSCIDNFLILAGLDSEQSLIYNPYTAYTLDQLSGLIGKGSYVILSHDDKLSFKGIDLSSNSLSGQLPEEITSLTKLMSLNISNNRISGTIPHAIGALSSLEVLDLSNNHLSCSIPNSMLDLHFLSLLDVSYNNLSGPIPNENQFLTFDESSYLGNSYLCGIPVEKKCSRNESYEDPHCNDNQVREKEDIQEQDTDWLRTPSFFISIALGFIAGFWGFWASLLFSTSWRHAYLRFLDSIFEKIYVTVAVGEARLRRKFQSQEIAT